MIKRYLQYIKEANENQIDSSKYTELKDELKTMIEKTIEKKFGKSFRKKLKMNT